MRFVRNDVRDRFVSQKNDHGLSPWRDAASQRRTCPKINICEIFGVFRFSTFSTVSAKTGSDAALNMFLQRAIEREAGANIKSCTSLWESNRALVWSRA